MTTTTLTIHGQPLSKQRAKKGRYGFYTPKETVSYESLVRQTAALFFRAPIAGPVRLTIIATFVPPRSWSKKKVAAHLHRPHIQKPDLDNIEKMIMDGLNRIAFLDDAQVAEKSGRKVWGVTPQVVVHIEPIGGE